MDIDKSFEIRDKDEQHVLLKSYITAHPSADNAKITQRGVNRLISAFYKV